MRVLHVEHPDGRGPGVFGSGAEIVKWVPASGESPSDAFDAVVLYGASTNIVDAPPWLVAETEWLRAVLDAGVPVLGVCFGAQLLAHALGAAVTRASEPEIGWYAVTLGAAGRADPVLGALPERFLAFQWHSWRCDVPEGGTALADSRVCLQAFRAGNAWGVQFHPEVDDATLAGWIDTYRNDPDAVAMGFDPAAAHAAREANLPRWNELGRRLFEAFMRAAA
ncbi:MAG TPA: type 1 glutamine amidotransferase [Solirubrobacteraceae bacterium]